MTLALSVEVLGNHIGLSSYFGEWDTMSGDLDFRILKSKDYNFWLYSPASIVYTVQ